MSYEVKQLPTFEQAFLNLRKKYRRIDEDYERLLNILETNPRAGDPIPGLEGKVHKIRMASSDMQRGKRGGFRIVYYFVGIEPVVYLLTIYAKTQKEDISVEEISHILSTYEL